MLQNHYRRRSMENDFKINAYFNDEGEDLDILLSVYLSNLLDKKRV